MGGVIPSCHVYVVCAEEREGEEEEYINYI